MRQTTLRPTFLNLRRSRSVEFLLTVILLQFFYIFRVANKYNRNKNALMLNININAVSLLSQKANVIFWRQKRGTK